MFRKVDWETFVNNDYCMLKLFSCFQNHLNNTFSNEKGLIKVAGPMRNRYTFRIDGKSISTALEINLGNLAMI